MKVKDKVNDFLVELKNLTKEYGIFISVEDNCYSDRFSLVDIGSGDELAFCEYNKNAKEYEGDWL